MLPPKMDQPKPVQAAPLDNISEAALNIKNAHSQVTRKRKRDQEDTNNESRSVFVATCLSSKSSTVSYTFVIVTVLPRTNLPLLWLNPSSASNTPPSGFVFKAAIQIVETWEEQVLIARHCPNGSLYAIERIEGELYTAYALRHWVSEESCAAAASNRDAIPGIRTLLEIEGRPDDEGLNCLPRKSSDITNSQTHADVKIPKNRKGAIARMSILTSSKKERSKDEQDQPLQRVSSLASTLEEERLVEPTPEEHKVLNSPEPHSSVQMQCEKSNDIPLESHLAESCSGPQALSINLLQQQYLDTLYLSKTSLAFFAKGPLSRARAQTQMESASISSDQLATFFRDSLLPSKKMDLKYKDSLSKFILEGNLREIYTDQCVSVDNSKKAKKSKKKPKLGKNGLWPEEEGYVLKWWSDREIIPGMTASSSSYAEELQYNIRKLRVRETEMQLLLMLEVMHLEKALSEDVNKLAKSSNPEIKMEVTETEVINVSTKSPTQKRLKDLHSEVDNLLDRLCIWHTVISNDWLASPGTTDRAEGSKSKSKDELRDFCAEVIMPFYASRLPEQCKSICRKLGGPEISPQRPKLMPKSLHPVPRRASSGVSKPTNRPAVRRTLERVLSEDQNLRHASPPVLSRSSTTPLASNLKREPSERPKSRGGMHKSVSFTNREIDLVADARAHEVKQRKLKKLTMQKEELKSAIDGLKKPNRINMAKTFMDDIERRNLDQKATRIHSEQQIQIMATPRKNRPYNENFSEPELPPNPHHHLEKSNQEHGIPSSTKKVQDSNHKSIHHRCLDLPQSSANKKAVLSAVHETPSKSSSSYHSTISHNPTQLIPQGNDFHATSSSPVPQSNKIFSTPSKKTILSSSTSTIDIPESAGRAMDRVMGNSGKVDMNLYQKLGWLDDEFDL